MPERFKIINERTYRDVFFRGFPVIPEKMRITYDNKTSKIIVQFKLLNISKKIIDTVYIKVNCYDTAKELILSVDEHILSMVNADNGASFGEKIPLYLDDRRISDVDFVIFKVVFKDGEVWKNDNNSMGEDVSPVRPVDISKDLLVQFKKESSKLKVKTNCQFEDFGTYWRCSCGMLNDSDSCCVCCTKIDSLKLLFSEEYLQKRLEEDTEKEREKNYNEAVRLQDGSLDDIRRAKEIFESISGYKDSADRAVQCGQRISELEAQLEKERQQQAEAMAKATKKRNTIIGIVSGSVVAVVAFVIALNNVIIPNVNYNKAMSLYESGSYEEAITAFEAMDGYKDSNDIIQKINFEILSEKREIVYKAMNNISTGLRHTVGLKSDGTVVAVGDNNDEQCNVSDWKDIVAVSAGDAHIVGLKSDGTVVAVGNNDYSQCDVSDWKDIVAVSAGAYYTVGLKSDGTVVAVGWNEYGLCDVSNWKDIIAVSVGDAHTIGLKSDGTVVAVGWNEYGKLSSWKDIIAVSAGAGHTVGLKSDGTVVAVGANNYGQCNVSDWKDIVAVSAGGLHTVGLKSDGTVVAVGANNYGQCNVSDWKDIVAVLAGGFHTVGLKSDGTVVAVGCNEYGQCDIPDWKLKMD